MKKIYSFFICNCISRECTGEFLRFRKVVRSLYPANRSNINRCCYSSNSLDDNIYPVTLPFQFSFNGTNYSAINVSTNGFITFGATAPATSYYTPISGTTTYAGAVSAFGRDLNSFFNIASTTGDISWGVVGTAPNREIVIQWSNFRPAYSTSTTSVYTFSFQIRLKETSNTVAVVYKSGSYLVGNTSISNTAQIGLRGHLMQILIIV
jgi:hypothetical protein